MFLNNLVYYLQFLDHYSKRYAFYKLNPFSVFSFIFPEKHGETFFTEGLASQSHCHAGPSATLVLTGLGEAALATTVTDLWGLPVSVQNKLKRQRAAGVRTRDFASVCTAC